MTYNDVWGRTQNRVMLDATITAVKGNSGDRNGGPTCVFPQQIRLGAGAAAAHVSS